jgi:hypothetical protein
MCQADRPARDFSFQLLKLVRGSVEASESLEDAAPLLPRQSQYFNLCHLQLGVLRIVASQG